MDFNRDYYSILQVGPGSSREEIRFAYRKMAKKYHPDINSDNGSNATFQLINEAYEVLSNDILRKQYDEFRSENKSEAKKSPYTGDVHQSNRKTRKVKRVSEVETRLYLRGKIRIKYWGDPTEKNSIRYDELFYKIYPAEVRVEVLESDIFLTEDVPQEYQRAYSAADVFIVPVSQPVKCIIKGNGADEFYELNLEDIRINNIVLSDVTKHEKRTYGVLSGNIYAYHPKIEVFESEEEVVECFGNTGKVEWKTEENIRWIRKEFYNPDCSTSWGEWVPLKSAEPSRPFSRPYKRRAAVDPIAGCFQWSALIPLIFLLIAFPRLFSGILILAFIWLLLYFGAGVFSLLRRLIPLILLFVFGLFIYGGIKSFRSEESNPIRQRRPINDSIQSEMVPAPVVNDNGLRPSPQSTADSIYSHKIKWADFSEDTFEIRLSVFASHVRSSAFNHAALSDELAYFSFAPLYKEILSFDTTGLGLVYKAFDSIRVERDLNEISFARTIVSCIQNIPYYLVVDRSCTEDYGDNFIRQYLSSCDNECCIGGQRFGVRTPVEFLSDLKGDCDTRALLLYAILDHFNIKVALLTSQYYKHALIAVSPSNQDEVGGLSAVIGGSNYYLWETTDKGFDIGQIPPELNDISKWSVTLLNN